LMALVMNNSDLIDCFIGSHCSVIGVLADLNTWPKDPPDNRTDL